MKRRAPRTRPGGVAVWGWYSVFLLPAASEGGTAAGLMLRAGMKRAFWAAWWTDDPQRVPDADPNDYGFVEGGAAGDQAIGAAYDALRRGRGPRVYDRSIGPEYAQRAYREGAPRRASTATDFGALAAEGLTALGLSRDATSGQITRAFRAAHPDHGGAAGVDMARLTELYRAALAAAKKREAEEQAAALAAGAAPKKRRGRKGPAAVVEQETLLEVDETTR